MPYSDNVKEKAVLMYCTRAIELYEDGLSPKEIKDESIPDDIADIIPPSGRSIRRWTIDFRDDGKPDIEKIYSYTDAVGETHTQTATDYKTEEDYIFKDGIYYIHISSAEDVLEIPEETMEKIWEWYSNWTGDAKTINQITQEIGIPRSWFNELRAKMGLTHDREPYPPEKLLEGDVEGLSDDLLQKKRRELAEKSQSKTKRAYRRAAKKWFSLKEGTLNPLREIIDELELSFEPRDYSVGDTSDMSVVIPISDVHLGSHNIDDPTSWNIIKAQDRLKDTYSRLIARVQESWFGTPEQLCIVFNGDYFQTDNFQNNTSRGTNVEAANPHKQILRSGFESAIGIVEVARSVSESCHVVMVEGNHDETTSFCLGLTLEKVYEDIDDTNVVVSNYSRKYLTYGNTLLGFTHGFGENIKDLPSIMASEASKMWGNTSTRVFFYGHYHGRKIDNSNPAGVMLQCAPALAPKTVWEDSKGYVGSLRGMQAHAIHQEEGPVTTTSVNIVD